MPGRKMVVTYRNSRSLRKLLVRTAGVSRERGVGRGMAMGPAAGPLAPLTWLLVAPGSSRRSTGRCHTLIGFAAGWALAPLQAVRALAEMARSVRAAVRCSGVAERTGVRISVAASGLSGPWKTFTCCSLRCRGGTYLPGAPVLPVRAGLQ